MDASLRWHDKGGVRQQRLIIHFSELAHDLLMPLTPDAGMSEVAFAKEMKVRGYSESKDAAGWKCWRVARWGAALALLLTPLAMMQVSDEWHWTFGSFVFAGTMIGGVMLLYEFVER